MSLIREINAKIRNISGTIINPATSDNQTNGDQITQLKGTISTLNSSITPLNASATFTGTWEDATNVSMVGVHVKTDQLGTCYFDNSSDGINVDRTFTHKLTDATNFSLFFGISPRCKYFRIRFTNTSITNQTIFRLQTILNDIEKGAVYLPIDEAVTDNSTAKLVKSVITGKNIETGVYENIVTSSDGYLFTTNESYEDSIAEGYVPGHIAHSHIGRTTNVNTTLTDIWNGGGIYVFPATAQQMHVVSTSANDTLAGTGVQKVRIIGLDASYNEIQEVVNMNGLTNVTTVNSYLRINKFISEQFGTGGTSAGTITLKNTADTITYAEILTGLSTSRQMIYTVPLGYRLFIKKVEVSGGVGGNTVKSEFMIFTLKSTWNGTSQINGFTASREYGVIQGSSSITYEVPLVFPEKTDIKMSVVGDYAGGATAVASFDGWLDPNI